MPAPDMEPWWPMVLSAPAQPQAAVEHQDPHLFHVENGKLHYVRTLTMIQIAASFVLV